MNWKTTSESCPKAWAEFVANDFRGPSINPAGGLSIKAWGGHHGIYNPRDLYDHFDALGVVVCVDWSNGDGFGWWIVVPHFANDSTHATRTEAESAAFEKAFELRENQLTR